MEGELDPEAVRRSARASDVLEQLELLLDAAQRAIEE
jgi:hypothetical protein